MSIESPAGTAPAGVRTAGAAALAGPSPWRRGDQVIVNVLVVLLVLTQRIGIPMAETSISVAIPIGYLLIGVLAVRGSLGISRIRVELLLVALAACFAATVAVSESGKDFSFPSLMLLVVIYLPWILRARTSDGFALVASAGRTFVWTMLVLAPIGVLQLASQFAGVWQYEDYLGNVLLPDYIVPNYNFNNALEFGSTTFKGTAFVLLEPSFLSQFCALAVIIGLVLRVRAWQLIVLIAGVASSVSGTGIFLLMAGAVLLLLRAPQLLRVGYVVAAAIAVWLVLQSPVAALLLDRSGEFTETQSSGYSRFVAPYIQVLEGLADDPSRYAIGDGAGTSEDLLVTNGEGFSEVVLYVILPKLVFEYGVVAGGLFVIFLVVATLRGSPWRVVPGSVLFMVFFLSGALLQPQTAFLAWIFTTLGSREDPDPVPQEQLDAAQPDPVRQS